MYQELILTDIDHLSKASLEPIFDSLNCLGSEEFAIEENRVDEILGDRSYSGGDISLELINEVEDSVTDLPVKYYFSEKEDLSLLKDFLDEHKISYDLKMKREEDWNESWRSHFSPIQLGKKLEIVPSWYENYQSECQDFLYLYPGQGFGTGNHETTYLCLKLFTELEEPLQNVLDFGAGSGILGIAAQKMKKSQVDYFDIDKAALENNKQNLQINNITSNYRLIHLEERNKLKANYDLIFANILKPVLLEEASYLTEILSKDGTLILSGLLVDQLEEVKAVYEKLGVICSQEVIKGDWGALKLNKA